MKNKVKKYETEEQMEVKKFIFVLLGIILIVVGIYFFTRAFVTKDLFKQASDVTYTSGTVNYDVAVVGTMLNRSDKEYYVVAYSSENNSATYYNTLLSKYLNNEDAMKVYYLDLNNELNKEYVATDENISKSFTSIKELKFGNITLLKVKDGKVTKFITDLEKIKVELGI